MKVVYYEQELKEEIARFVTRPTMSHIDVMVSSSIVVVTPVTSTSIHLYNIVCSLDDTGSEGTLHNSYDVIHCVSFMSVFYSVPIVVSYMHNPKIVELRPKRPQSVRSKIKKLFEDELPF